jgi:hypothetical protein
MVPDHVPALAGDTGLNRAGTAYCISYMRSLLRHANEEVEPGTKKGSAGS